MTHRITSGTEALEVAADLASAFAAGADRRDHDRRLPVPELDELAASGLLAITVPQSYGGPELPASVLAGVIATLAAADPSIAQIPQSHFTFLDALRRGGAESLRHRVFAEVLAGGRVANAQAERSSSGRSDGDSTIATRGDDGRLRVNGTKYYCTGALFASILAVRARDLTGARPRSVIAFLPTDTPGVSVIDDWDGMGQRTTGSGTVVLADAVVEDDALVDFTALFDSPTTYGARAQLVHAAIDTGLARGALTAGATAAAAGRPWFEAEVSANVDDPLLISAAGEVEIAVRSAEALLARAAERIDAAEFADVAGTENVAAKIAEASLATAAAKVVAGRAARTASSALFDLGGSRAASRSANLSRYWRDARTHTLHDPERWKVAHLGRWALTGRAPINHPGL